MRRIISHFACLVPLCVIFNDKKKIIMNKSILILLISLLFFSCKETKKTNPIDNTEIIEEEVETNKNDNKLEFNINDLVENYLENSDTSTIRFTNINCGTKESLDLYLKGIYTYSISEIKNLEFDFNNDNKSDYVITYTADNCWQGNGSDNYLSNYVFATTNNNKITINEELTNSFKDKFTKYINNKFVTKDIYNVKTQFFNGIEFKQCNKEFVSGEFNILTSKCNSSQPCISGTFNFNTISKEIVFDNVKFTDI
jgi:hypothetical protein